MDTAKGVVDLATTYGGCAIGNWQHCLNAAEDGRGLSAAGGEG